MKRKKVAKKTRAKKRVSLRRASNKTFYGLDHEFIIITGGGFLVIVLGILLFFR